MLNIDASNIVDLSEIKPEERPPTDTPEPLPASPSPQTASKAAFIDPAIVSLSRRPGSSTPSASGARRSPVKSVAAEPPSEKLDVLNALFQAKASEVADVEVAAANSVPATHIELAPDEPEVNNATENLQIPRQKKKKTRAKRTQHQKTQSLEENVELTEVLLTPNMQGNRGMGWRQTPILQSTASFQPFTSLKRNGKGRKGMNDNGWASEDVTEEMGEFDFENNLAKFDKRTVFEQIRKEDVVEDADRLVSHNRRPRPLTGGGKNLHPTENVLDIPSTVPQSTDFWNSEADVGVDADSRSGQAARRADSRPAGSRRSQSRKASAAAGPSAAVAVGGLPLSRVNSNVSGSEHLR